MKKQNDFMNELKKIVSFFLQGSLVVVCISLCSSLFGQDWSVPQDQKIKTAQFKFTDETIKKGEELFNNNCKSCHGNPGKKNFIPLTPSPGDPASGEYQAQTDGEMFYRISTGKPPMPSFKTMLTDIDKWNIISYIRSFNKNYVQPLAIVSTNNTVSASVKKTEQTTAVSSSATSGDDWNVPEKKKAKTATFKFTIETEKKGETLFNINCQSCHGSPGKKNFAKLTPSPGDPASADYQDQTDGEMYYKITVGKSPMPSFKTILISEDRWSVISYIRSFNKNYIQPDITSVANETEYTINLIVEKLADSNKVKVTAKAYSAKDTVIIKNVDISLYAKRYFGLLPVGEKKSSDENGIVIFNFPKDIPGDSAGLVTLVVKLSDEVGDFGESEITKKLQVGTPTHAVSLIDTRAMWSVNSQAPYWVFISYWSAVLLVLCCIGYILKQLSKINKLGKSSKHLNN